MREISAQILTQDLDYADVTDCPPTPSLDVNYLFQGIFWPGGEPFHKFLHIGWSVCGHSVHPSRNKFTCYECPKPTGILSLAFYFIHHEVFTTIVDALQVRLDICTEGEANLLLYRLSSRLKYGLRWTKMRQLGKNTPKLTIFNS
jgi:hypothetical protein